MRGGGHADVLPVLQVPDNKADVVPCERLLLTIGEAVQRLPLKLAAPGMILAREITTQEGQVLCGTGTELTAQLLQRISKSGIHSVTVDGHPVRLPGEESLGERIKGLEDRFSKVKDDPVLRALMKVIAEHWIEQEKKGARSQNTEKN
jgi:hypothetical protein